MFEVKVGVKPLILTVVALGFLFAGESGFPQEDSIGKSRCIPKYRIGQQEYAGGNEKLLLLFVSIKSKYLNPKDMVSLANSINCRFSSKEQIQVSFFTNHKSAKTFSLNPGSQNYRSNMKALAAAYYLNRRTGEEYVSFSSDGYLPSQTQRINLGKGSN